MKFESRTEVRHGIYQGTLDLRNVEDGIAVTIVDEEAGDMIDGQIVLSEEQATEVIDALLALLNRPSYDHAYDHGFEDGESEGYEKGYERGYEVGNERGYDAGMEEVA